MIKVMFFDGVVREYEDGVFLYDVVVSIFNLLVKKVLVVKVNGELYDFMWLFEGDVEVVLIMVKDLEGLEFIWYDVVYVLV